MSFHRTFPLLRDTMTPRVDTATRTVQASPSDVYRAFAEPGAMERWIPPAGMTATILHFDFREGGSYRMRLTYLDPRRAQGKSTADSDEVYVRLMRLVRGQQIEQEVLFESDDPSFAGAMRMVWTFDAEGTGTRVTVRAKNVPDGIRPEDHAAGLSSTLENLATFLGGATRAG